MIQPEDIPAGIRYVGLEHIVNGGALLDAGIVKNGELRSTKFRFSAEHILYGKLRPYLGKIAAPRFAGVCSTEIIPIRPGPDMDCNFLLHFLRQPSQIDLATARSLGANLPRLSPSELAKFVVPAPSLPEQRRIAAILNQTDAMRVKRREALAQLDELAQAIFTEIFGDIIKNERGWVTRPLINLCFPKQWPTITSQQLLSSGYPVYGANGQIGFYSDFNHKMPTVLVTCRGATCGTVNISPPNCYVTGNAMALDELDTDKLEIRYLATALRWRGLSDVISGSAQPQITRQSLSPIKIAVPPLNLQHLYRDKVEAIDSLRLRYTQAIIETSALFSSLQHRAFTGAL